MSDSRAVIDEVVPWRTRAARRVRTAFVDVRAWLSGWGVGGVLTAGLVVIVLGYVVLASRADHVPTTPCHQAQGLVDELATAQQSEGKVALTPSMVQNLHVLGPQLSAVADDAYGSLADNLHELAGIASGVQVGDHLKAQDALSQENFLCRG